MAHSLRDIRFRCECCSASFSVTGDVPPSQRVTCPLCGGDVGLERVDRDNTARRDDRGARSYTSDGVSRSLGDYHHLAGKGAGAYP